MKLQGLMDLSSSVEGASFSLKTADHLTMVRDSDGVAVTVRLYRGGEFQRYRREDDSIVAVRWFLPVESELSTLSRINSEASIAVATANRHENLYGKSGQTYFRAQLLATALEPSRFLAALARDVGLVASIEAPAPVAIEDVLASLNAHPVTTPEEALLDAISGRPADHSGEHYRFREGILAGPSSVGMSKGGASPVAVEIRVCDLGLVRVRHVCPAPTGEDVLRTLNRINSESSSQEDLVTYHRAFLWNGDSVAVEFSATFAELESELFARKIQGLEIAVSSYLAGK